MSDGLGEVAVAVLLKHPRDAYKPGLYRIICNIVAIKSHIGTLTNSHHVSNYDFLSDCHS